MTSFSIDDVRDTMPREVTEFLARIELSSRRFLDEPGSAQPALAGGPGSLLRTIRRDGHAIYGTSSLVSVNSLAACADLVERLAEHGYAELAEAERRAARARRMVELLPAGVQHMRKILALELKHQSDEAEWVAVEWQAEAEALLSELAPDFAKASLYPSQAPEGGGLSGLLGYADLVESIGTLDEAPEALSEDDIEYLEEEVRVESIPSPPLRRSGAVSASGSVKCRAAAARVFVRRIRSTRFDIALRRARRRAILVFRNQRRLFAPELDSRRGAARALGYLSARGARGSGYTAGLSRRPGQRPEQRRARSSARARVPHAQRRRGDGWALRSQRPSRGAPAQRRSPDRRHGPGRLGRCERARRRDQRTLRAFGTRGHQAHGERSCKPATRR